MTTDDGRRPDVTLVVPSRNEALNVVPLLERLAAAFDEGTSWEVLFVDDSDDATPAAVRQAGAKYPVRLHHRPPGQRDGGLGGAVQEGFALARGSVIAVMDADLQHPPEIIPPLVAPILAGWADLVAGTRYTNDGTTSGLDGWWRRAVSSNSRRLVHALVPRSRCLSDPMSGLFALDRSVIEGVDLQTHGFKILMEVAARGRPTRVANLSYHFAERHAGASKASVTEGARFLTHLLRLVRARASISSLPQPETARNPLTSPAAAPAPSAPSSRGAATPPAATPPAATPPVAPSPAGSSPAATSPAGSSPAATSPAGSSPAGSSPVAPNRPAA